MVSEDWMTAVYRALKPTGSFYLAIGDEFAADLCRHRAAEDRVPHAELDHLALHVRPADEEDVRQEPHAHPVLHEEKPDAEELHVQRRRDSRRQRPPDDLRRRPGQPQGQAAGRHVVPAPAGSTPARVFRAGLRHVEREPRLRHVQGARRLARLPDADRRAQPDHQGVEQSRRRRARPVQRQRHDGRVGALLGRKYVGIDQSDEYVEYARKRLQHALEAKEKKGKDAAITDTTRESRILTPTDAFGRKRRARPARRSANGQDGSDEDRLRADDKYTIAQPPAIRGGFFVFGGRAEEVVGTRHVGVRRRGPICEASARAHTGRFGLCGFTISDRRYAHQFPSSRCSRRSDQPPARGMRRWRASTPAGPRVHAQGVAVDHPHRRRADVPATRRTLTARGRGRRQFRRHGDR